MGSVNSVFIVGHLGADPEVKHMQNNRAVGNLSVATSEQWKDKSGELQEHTEWFARIYSPCWTITFHARSAPQFTRASAEGCLTTCSTCMSLGFGRSTWVRPMER